MPAPPRSPCDVDGGALDLANFERRLGVNF
jgi:hypothetical protein